MMCAARWLAACAALLAPAGATLLLGRGRRAEAASLSGAVASAAGTPEQDQAMREAWLASHLKDVFELDHTGRIAAQSGLNMPWNYDEVKPRNARDDCGDGPGAVLAAELKRQEEARQRGELSASRLSSP
mmetsp:Transcript_111143/g.319360  ORF Transcript_111143/g.319360 Transcript_111143/m.319360 type:complete len:130 (-) Transcript_111143:114-503(-)